MVQYIPMIILMAILGAIGLYWAIGTRHFISWSRKYKTSFPRFSDDNSEIGGHNGAASAKTASSATLRWGVRLVGIALAGVSVATIVNMFING
jgi:hypothetical protein